MSNFSVSLSLVAALALLSPLASADELNDPAFAESGKACPSGSSPAWCAATQPTNQLAKDPLSGLTTVAYYLNATYFDPAHFVTGDVEIMEGPGNSVVGDLIRFEVISVGGVNTSVAFIFSDDSGLPADVGIPTTFQSTFVKMPEGPAGSFNVYSPGSSSNWSGHSSNITSASLAPGYDSAGTSPYGTAPGYQIFDSADVPEPGSILLLGTVVGLAAVLVRRKTRIV